MPSATDEVLKLRKELRLKEADFNKEKALLLQKVEQFEQQIKDFKEREETQKKVYESMINCLNSNDPNAANQALSQLQTVEKQAQAEILELQSQKRRLYDEQEYKDKQYQRQLTDKDLFIKDIQHQLDRTTLERKQQVFQWDQERKEFQQKISQIQNEKDQVAQKLELINQCKTNELQMEIERLKLEHQRQMEKMKSEYEQNLKEIKYFHEQEKCSLQTKVERSNNELSSLFQMVKHKGAQEDDFSKESIKRKREEMESQVHALHDEVEMIKNQYEKDVAQITQDKIEAENKAMKLQKQLDKIKNAPKPIKIDLSEVIEKKNKQTEQETKAINNLKEEIEILQKENEKLNEQVKRLRKEMIENQDYIEKIEANERKLRQQMKLKSNHNQEQDKTLDIRKQLNNEKKKNIELQEKVERLKEQIESIKDKNLTDILSKDQKIIKLSKELRETERKLQDIHSVFNSNQTQNNNKHQRNQSPFTINHDISQIHNRNVSHSPLARQIANQSQFQSTHLNQQTLQNFQISPRSATHKNNQSSLICIPMLEGQQIMKQISQLEFTLLKTCQRMADQAIRMECGTCFMTFETADFYDHIIQEHPNIQNKNQTQIINNQTQQSMYQYNSNKINSNAINRYAEDRQSSTQQLNILSTSPKINPQVQKNNYQPIPRWAQSSRSFTCLLNEIEEEEKHVNDSSKLQQQQNSTITVSFIKEQCLQPRKLKSPMATQQDLDNLKNKSRNMLADHHHHNTSQVQLNTMGSGNTLQSVIRSQKEIKKIQANNLSQSRIQNPQSTTVMTACRTEIQNLKRQNKKLTNQLQEQETKINDVSKDCSVLKKQVKKEKNQESGTKLTTEIKGLLEKLVTYQANSQQTLKSDQMSSYGAYTSRQQNNNFPMSTDSLVELRSSASSSQIIKRKKSGQKSKGHFHKESKSPIPNVPQKHKLGQNPPQNHQNKENSKVSFKQFDQTTAFNNSQKKVPQLNLFSSHSKKQENKRDQSITDDKMDNYQLTTERQQYHNVKKSAELCTNSPRRYQNYFEILQSVDDTIINQAETQRLRRYSPSNEEEKKLSLVQSQNRINAQLDHQSTSRNLNNQGLYHFKQQNTNASSNNNLVLYDSSNTEIFKSKNLALNQKKYDHNHHHNQNEVQKKNKKDNRPNYVNQNYSNDELSNNDNEGMPSSCPSLDEYEENQILRQRNNYTEDIFSTSADEDPFITGRFCENAAKGKQFLFKYSNKNSNNNTMIRGNNNYQ